ncbi:stalk domain-containing protein [Tindallia californiensis]|uniref:Copper amine oxidase N-terminal domain-containing protein n=1 Tax=Tindallia californiensis TaxID=159292 RepID=A0A1H3PE09_9FIRM|nr:stalk domain-containing protein [Tindallia californiensis]SDY99297.1 Copper amine oxidase N-terminal domain-containing protein [Tindallia californiensis]
MKEKMKYGVTGLALGVALTLSVTSISAFTEMINVYLRPDIQYVVDGEIRPMPSGYTTLVHEGRTYVPMRYMAQTLDADVLWDEITQRVIITTPQPEVLPEPEEPEEEPAEELEAEEEIEEEPAEEPAEEPEEEEEDTGQPAGNYRRLPVTQYHEDLEVTVNLVTLRDKDGRESASRGRVDTTRVYLRVENEDRTPYEIRQGKTIAIVDGKEYKTADVGFQHYDTKWYKHLQRDDVIEGYISLPDIPEDAKEMRLTIFAEKHGVRPELIEIEFDIALDLK